MWALWERFVQSIFGESGSLQGDWLGWEEHDLDCDCSECDTLFE